MSKRIHGEDTLEYANALTSIASYYNRRGIASNAEPYWRSALAIRQRCGDAAAAASAQMGLAACVEGQERWDEAIEILQDLQGVLPHLQGEEHREREARCKTLLGRIRKKQERYSEAEEYMEAAIEYYESLSLPGIQYHFAIKNLVDLLREQSKFDEAKRWQKKLVQETLKVYDRESGWTSIEYIRLGLVETDLEEWQAARKSLQEGLQIRDAFLPDGDGWTNIAMEALEKVEAGMKKKDANVN